MIIVGGGPAGCAAALSLPPGTRGLLIDRSSPDTESCCGGLLAPDAQEALAALGLTLPPVVRVNPEPHMVRVHDLDSGRSQSYRRDYLNVDRRAFDSWLLALAAERVEVRRRTRFAGRDGTDVLLRTGGVTEAVPARLVIGADGAGSAVRRHSFPGRPTPPLMLALQAALPRPAAAPPENGAPPEHLVLFSSDLTDFYAWAIPKGGHMLIGCAFHDKRGARERFEQVLDWYRRELDLEGQPSAVSGRYLSQPRRWPHLFPGDGQVLLAGEASGLVSPSSGEGISFALISGAAAGAAAGRAPADAREVYRRAFAPLARSVMIKTLKARVIYSPAARRWALRLPWCP